ncbi:peptidase M23 [Mucilaginibacter hurinus]|uniref:Peptidase M23 n=1 Tax=Mucilaginibacter hurinus TaxID=2201324 RepID=A0A367GTP2_9SPHI|nr:peptidoglycan DD-metalloendopeptidase family protein [Mucilaginibacter hurinus]RCH56749.1 peptidase M23 [Mucilaginibacter hurinus]
MDASAKLASVVKDKRPAISKVVDFNAKTDKVFRINLSNSNDALRNVVTNVAAFSQWINAQLSSCGYKYAAGGYMENRVIYKNRNLFESGDKARSIHLGIDVWGMAGTAVYSPIAGIVHSFNDNSNDGDYGPTIIMQHDLNGFMLYSLYGHLSRKSLKGLFTGQQIKAGEQIGEFGVADENGGWPPHLHFQLMLDMEGMQGDYPGVCSLAEKDKYLKNVPDPTLLLPFFNPNYR